MGYVGDKWVFVGVLVGRGGRVGRAQVSKSRGPGFDPTDAVSNLGQVRLPHVALVSKGRF